MKPRRENGGLESSETSGMTARIDTTDSGVPIDTSGQAIAPARLRRAMVLNTVCGALGVMWFTACAPQTVLPIFLKNYLGASDEQVGYLVATMQIVVPCYLVGVLVYGRLAKRKTFWASAHVLHRLLTFALAGVALWAATGGNKQAGVWIILGASFVSAMLMAASAAGWWSWMADLVPENIRGTFFSKRGTVINILNTLWFFGIMGALDYVSKANAMYVFAAVFATGTVLGVVDILLHATLPEPKRLPEEMRVGWREFVEPLGNRNFMVFSSAMGAYAFGLYVFIFFIGPTLTADVAKGGFGAPKIWLSISLAVNQAIWFFTVTAWGKIMDRFGRKPAVILGAMFPALWTLYVFMTPTNYAYVLIAITILASLISPGYWYGAGQWMLTLTPVKNRTTYIAWHSVIVGLLAAGGAVTGGWLMEGLKDFHTQVWGLHLMNFHVVAIVAMALCVPGVWMLGRTREGKEKPVGFVVSVLATPAILRAFVNMRVIESAADSARTARAIRTTDGVAGHLVVSDILKRLDDPDAEVREEAAWALGRIGATEVVETLVRRLRDPSSTIRLVIARSLGQLGDPRAVPALVECLSDKSEELQDACARALGAIGGRESVRRLLRMLEGKHAERVLVSSAEGVSKHGILEAAWEILPRMHSTANPVLRGQLAIAMGNLLGQPGEFYQVLTSETARQGARLGRLFRGAKRAIRSFRPALPREKQQDLDPLETKLRRARGLLEGQSYRATIEAFYGILQKLTEMVIGKAYPDDVAIDYAFARDAKLGLGFWFIREIKNLLATVDDADLLHTDALLALYFLSVYRLPPKDSAGDGR